MEVTIECRWTKENIETILLEKMRSEGLKIIPQQKRKEGEPDKLFVWPKNGRIKVRAQAMIDPDARQVEEDGSDEVGEEEPQESFEPMDLSMLPEGANVEAIRAIESSAAEDTLEKAAKRRRLGPGESRERDE